MVHDPWESQIWPHTKESAVATLHAQIENFDIVSDLVTIIMSREPDLSVCGWTLGSMHN